MTPPTDPFEWLRSTNPVEDARHEPDPRVDPAARAMLAQIMAESTGPGGRRRQRRRRFVIPVVAAALATTAAAGWVFTREADDPTQVACFQDVDLGSDITDGSAGALDPIAACEGVWEQGAFSITDDAPALEACVLDTGIIGVFPADGGDPCGRLGVARWEQAPGSEDDELVDLRESITEMFLAECIEFPRALGIVQQELNSTGVHGWSVVSPEEIPPERPCASVAIDVPSRTVTLVPIPDDWDS